MLDGTTKNYQFYDWTVDGTSTETRSDQWGVCTIYEHETVNYGLCEPNLSGFYSPTEKNTPTEAAAANNYYTQVEQSGE